jgi:hypothetical protein
MFIEESQNFCIVRILDKYAFQFIGGFHFSLVPGGLETTNRVASSPWLTFVWV